MKGNCQSSSMLLHLAFCPTAGMGSWGGGDDGGGGDDDRDRRRP